MIDRKDRLVLAVTAGFVGFGSAAGNVQADALKMLKSPGNQIQRNADSAQMEELPFALPPSQARFMRGSYFPVYQESGDDSGDQPLPNPNLGTNIIPPDPNLSAGITTETRVAVEIQKYNTQFTERYPLVYQKNPKIEEKTREKIDEIYTIGSLIEPELAERIEELKKTNEFQPAQFGPFRNWLIQRYTIALDPNDDPVLKNRNCMYLGFTVVDAQGNNPEQFHGIEVISSESNPNAFETYVEIYMIKETFDLLGSLLVPRMKAGISYEDLNTYVSSDQFKEELDLNVSVKGLKYARKMTQEPYTSRLKEYGIKMSEKTLKMLEETKGMNDRQIKEYLRKLNYPSN